MTKGVDVCELLCIKPLLRMIKGVDVCVLLIEECKTCKNKQSS